MKPSPAATFEIVKSVGLSLVRLAQLNRDALRDLLAVSHRLALAKSRRRKGLSRRSQAKAD